MEDERRFLGIDPGSEKRQVEVVAATGVKTVRLNFEGNFNDPSEELIESYRGLITSYQEQDISFYPLIGAESIADGLDEASFYFYDESGSKFYDEYGNPIRNEEGISNFINRFVDAADKITDAYLGELQAAGIGIELFNEPNNDMEGDGPVLPPDIYARLLTETYQRIKIEKGKNVQLNFGGILSHDLSDNVENDSGSTYFQQVVAAGRQWYGWDDMRDAIGTYPFDALTYHIYVAQGSTDQEEVKAQIQRNIQQIAQALGEVAPEDEIIVSEIGWSTEVINEGAQASNIQAAYEVLKDTPMVRRMIIFCLLDFSLKYGIYRLDPEGFWAEKEAVRTVRGLTTQQ